MIQIISCSTNLQTEVTYLVYNVKFAHGFVHLVSCSHIVSYRETFNISRTLVGNRIVDHSDVIEESPVDAAPTTSSFWT